VSPVKYEICFYIHSSESVKSYTDTHTVSSKYVGVVFSRRIQIKGKQIIFNGVGGEGIEERRNS
jgi:hypothetical protein